MSVDPTVYEFCALTASEAQATEFVAVFVYLYVYAVCTRHSIRRVLLKSVCLSVCLSGCVLFLLRTSTTIPSSNSSSVTTKGIAATAAVHLQVL